MAKPRFVCFATEILKVSLQFDDWWVEQKSEVPLNRAAKGAPRGGAKFIVTNPLCGCKMQTINNQKISIKENHYSFS